MLKYALVLSLLSFLLILTNAAQDSSFALLDISAPQLGFQKNRICANYQQFFLKSLPKSAEDATAFNLAWWNNQQGQVDVCTSHSVLLTNRIVPLTYPTKNLPDVGTCKRKVNETEFIQVQIDQLESAKAGAALFLLDKGVSSEYHVKNYLFSRFYNPKVSNNTSTFYLYKEQFNEIIAKIGSNPFEQVSFRFYRPADPFLDAGVFVLLCLATGCILVGCLWYATSLKRKIDLGDLKIDSSGQLVEATEHDSHLPVRTENASDGSVSPDRRPDEPEKLCCFRLTGTCLHIFYTLQALFIVVLVLMLSFFYRPIAVEFFNIFIVIGATFCIQKCLTPIARLCIPDPELTSFAQLLRVNEERRAETSRCWVPAFIYKPIRPVACLILILALAFTLTWRFHMDHPQAYLMLDFMNICICIYSVKGSELRSLRLITFFLIAMFCYDIFMVFGTRLFTENGCSVMVQVVTGMDCTKFRKTDYSRDWPVPPSASDYTRPPKIPLLFYIPLLSNPVGQCYDSVIEGEAQHMMLGLGDVIAPGYLIAFAFYLDVRKRNRFYVYGSTAIVGYAIGMITTFISLKLMNTAQPALIYLVPFTLVPLILLCLYKGTLREAWKGNIN